MKVRSWLIEKSFPESFNLDEFARAFPAYSKSQLQDCLKSADDLLEECLGQNIQTVCLCDPDYPSALKQIADPPPVLYFKGPPKNLTMQAFSVVGTRKASPRGLIAAEHLGESLIRHGFCVVSGLALGIDAAAHRGALKGGCPNDGCPAVAVLAHGLHTIQPASNRGLALKILECGGTLVSEHPPGVAPRPAEFVRRNRIQSGLSLGSIIVESGEEGGSIHQAKFTVQQGRLLAVALPDGEDKNFNSSGGQMLSSTLGAHIIRKPKDLINLLISHPNQH